VYLLKTVSRFSLFSFTNSYLTFFQFRQAFEKFARPSNAAATNETRQMDKLKLELPSRPETLAKVLGPPKPNLGQKIRRLSVDGMCGLPVLSGFLPKAKVPVKVSKKFDLLSFVSKKPFVERQMFGIAMT
jgi:hypothetical protein